ncbi:MAG: LPS export ABC transporter ATP-binding protein [Armatimonadota bacterium]
MTVSLRVEELVKVYKGRKVVNGVSFSMTTGEIVGLLGPNGAGKTTSFYMTIGLVQPTSGRVYLDDKDITSQPMFARARMGLGYLAQEPSVFRKLTVEDNLRLVLQARGVESAEAQKQIDMLLEDFHITRLRTSPAYVLSGGERRRVEIARAIAAAPQFILLDEPFTGVDPIAIADLQKIIASLREKLGIGILITDHNVRATLRITDRAYIIAEGNIVTEGASEDLPQNPIARQFYLGQEYDNI